MASLIWPEAVFLLAAAAWRLLFRGRRTAQAPHSVRPSFPRRRCREIRQSNLQLVRHKFLEKQRIECAETLIAPHIHRLLQAVVAIRIDHFGKGLSLTIEQKCAAITVPSGNSDRRERILRSVYPLKSARLRIVPRRRDEVLPVDRMPWIKNFSLTTARRRNCQLQVEDPPITAPRDWQSSAESRRPHRCRRNLLCNA